MGDKITKNCRFCDSELLARGKFCHECLHHQSIFKNIGIGYAFIIFITTLISILTFSVKDVSSLFYKNEKINDDSVSMYISDIGCFSISLKGLRKYDRNMYFIGATLNLYFKDSSKLEVPMFTHFNGVKNFGSEELVLYLENKLDENKLRYWEPYFFKYVVTNDTIVQDYLDRMVDLSAFHIVGKESEEYIREETDHHKDYLKVQARLSLLINESREIKRDFDYARLDIKYRTDYFEEEFKIILSDPYPFFSLLCEHALFYCESLPKPLILE